MLFSFCSWSGWWASCPLSSWAFPMELLWAWDFPCWLWFSIPSCKYQCSYKKNQKRRKISQLQNKRQIIFITDLWPMFRRNVWQEPGGVQVSSPAPGMCKQEWQALIYCLHSHSCTQLAMCTSQGRGKSAGIYFGTKSYLHSSQQKILLIKRKSPIYVQRLAWSFHTIFNPSKPFINISEPGISNCWLFCPVDSAGMKSKYFHKANFQILVWNVKQSSFLPLQHLL